MCPQHGACDMAWPGNDEKRPLPQPVQDVQPESMVRPMLILNRAVAALLLELVGYVVAHGLMSTALIATRLHWMHDSRW